MDIGSYMKQRLPGAVRALTELAIAKMASPPPPDDPSEKFMGRRLDIINNYQRNLVLKEQEKQAPVFAPPVPAKTVYEPLWATNDCPYCRLEELAGVVRNHLLFIAQECQDDNLGPATGGMIPKAKETTEEFIRQAEALDAPVHVGLLAQLAVSKAQELLPKLEWINTCEEAQEAATIADEIWHRAAKSTQIYYANPDGPSA